MQYAAFTFIFKGKNAQESTPPIDFISIHLFLSAKMSWLYTLNSFITELIFSIIQIFYIIL